MQTSGNSGHDEAQLPRLNAVRLLTVIFIAIGYASTMPIGPGNPEILSFLGYDPSWIGIQVLFFFSGFLAMRSLDNGRSGITYLRSRVLRNIPLLALFTLISVIVIYPVFGGKTDNLGQLSVKLGRYFIETVSCVDPGRVLPGLLDDARYMCLIQGAIWTFRWGAIAHICAAIGGKLGLFKNRRSVAGLAAIALVGYFVVNYVQAKNGYSWLNNPLVGLRLGWPFLVGMTCFAFAEKLPTSIFVRSGLLAGFLMGAVIWHGLLPWTPAIEILLTAFWIYAAMLLALSKTPKLAVLQNWPHLALGLYLANWPTSQLLLLAYPTLSPLELIALSLPLSLLIAYGAHEIFSKRLYHLAIARSRQETVSSPPAFNQ